MLIEAVVGLMLGIVLIVIAEGLFRILGADAESRIRRGLETQQAAGPVADAAAARLERERRLRYLGGYR